MKRSFIIITLLITLFVITSCRTPQDGDTFEIALITDKGDIDDESFNQGAWEGLVEFGDEHDLTYKYYRPAEATDAAYLAQIQLAVTGGAKLIICPGYLFEPVVNTAQKQYPEVKFVILDGNPANVTGGTLDDNVYSIFYSEEEAGFLAGYACVMEGFRKLGFMGGQAVPPVIKFGHGFIIGANEAAKELGLADKAIDFRYYYTGTFSESPDIKTRAAAWYSAGTDVIFACGGSIGKSIMSAAEEEDGRYVVGVDVDQSSNSNTVITSAMKALGTSVQLALQKYVDNKWDEIGGTSVVLDATAGGVALSNDFSRFKNFTKEQYDALFAAISADEFTIEVDLDADPNEYTALTKVSVGLEQ